MTGSTPACDPTHRLTPPVPPGEENGPPRRAGCEPSRVRPAGEGAKRRAAAPLRRSGRGTGDTRGPRAGPGERPQ